MKGESLTQTELQRGSEKVLLCVLGPSCRVCERNWPHWKSLMARLPQSVKPIMVDLWDQISPEYLRRMQLSERDVLTRLSGSTVLAYRFRYVPQTVLLDRMNRVLFSSEGELDERAMGELLRIANSQ